MVLFDIKKFAAFIVFHDDLRNLYFDTVENQGVDSRWDVYHVLANEESIPDKEAQIMLRFFNEKIVGNSDIEKFYNSAIEDFPEKVRQKIARNT